MGSNQKDKTIKIFFHIILLSMKLLTEKNWKLELIKDQTIGEFRDDCKQIYKRSFHSIGYEEVTIELEHDLVAIINSGDWHIGNAMTNVDRWSEDIEKIWNDPRVFAILTGDYTDNLDALKGKSGSYEQNMSVPEAKNKVRQAVTFMKDSILGVVQGCHDEWFFHQDSWDISQYLADHCDGYWLGFEGIINLIVGDETYRFLARHRFRRNSTDNPAWGMKYKFRTLQQPVDVVFGAHHHKPVIEQSWERGQWTYLIETGSYKPYDRFIDQRDIKKAPIATPGVILYPDIHKVVPLMELDDLIKAIE